MTERQTHPDSGAIHVAAELRRLRLHGHCSIYPRADWLLEAASGRTDDGYWVWSTRRAVEDGVLESLLDIRQVRHATTYAPAPAPQAIERQR